MTSGAILFVLSIIAFCVLTGVVAMLRRAQPGPGPGPLPEHEGDDWPEQILKSEARGRYAESPAPEAMQERTKALGTRRRAAGSAAVSEQIHRRRVELIRLTGTIIVSAIVLAAALYVLLTAGTALESQKWAVGSIGTVVGYWLKQ
jgi:hypothetical protein